MTRARFAMMVRGEIPDTPEVREDIKRAVERALITKCNLEVLVVEFRTENDADKAGTGKVSAPGGGLSGETTQDLAKPRQRFNTTY